MRAIIILSASLLGYLPLPLLADNGSGLQPGTRVRVSAKQFFQKAGAVEVESRLKPRYLDTVESVKSDTLEFAPDDLNVTLLVPFQYITKLEIKKGEKSRTGKAALIGLGTGAAIGTTLGAVSGGGFGGRCNALSDDDELEGCSDDFAIIGGIGFGLLGGIIGSIAGATAGPGEVWEEVQIK